MEARADKMKDANIPKFSELKEKVASLSDMTEVEDYLKVNNFIGGNSSRIIKIDY